MNIPMSSSVHTCNLVARPSLHRTPGSGINAYPIEHFVLDNKALLPAKLFGPPSAPRVCDPPRDVVHSSLPVSSSLQVPRRPHPPPSHINPSRCGYYMGGFPSKRAQVLLKQRGWCVMGLWSGDLYSPLGGYLDDKTRQIADH